MKVMTDRVNRIFEFLKKEKLFRMRIFDYHSWIPVPTETIYNNEEDDVSIIICRKYGYLEVFGLSDYEYFSLLEHLEDYIKYLNAEIRKMKEQLYADLDRKNAEFTAELIEEVKRNETKDME